MTNTNIAVGDTVRINEDYQEVADALRGILGKDVGDNKIGATFTVTEVVDVTDDPTIYDHDTFYVQGDPEGWGIWGKFVTKVEA